jgi:hypothetical protein
MYAIYTVKYSMKINGHCGKNKEKKMNASLKALLASYGRSILGAATALYLAGVTDPLDLAWSLVAALLPVAIRYINPNDPAFGITPSKEEIEKAVAKATPKKAPVKRKPAAVAKKTAKK